MAPNKGMETSPCPASSANSEGEYLTFSLAGEEYGIGILKIKEIIATLPTGLVVDSVSEVVNIKREDIADTPSFGTTVQTDYILGMAKLGSGVKILLDIDRVLGADDIAQLEQAA
jgi:chemotaxis signal transduction protein